MHLFERLLMVRRNNPNMRRTSFGSSTSPERELRRVDKLQWSECFTLERVPKEDLDALVFDFLEVSQKKKAAECFRIEANFRSRPQSAAGKNPIRELKQRLSKKIGLLEIDEVQSELDQISHDILQTCQVFKTELKILKLFTLLRSGEFEAGLAFASQEVLPLVKCKVASSLPAEEARNAFRKGSVSGGLCEQLCTFPVPVRDPSSDRKVPG